MWQYSGCGMKVAVVDYGFGNIASVCGALEKIGHAPVVARTGEALQDAEKLILPGVGAFGDGMESLRERGFVPALHTEVIDREKPILGICLGFQLLAKKSEEFGDWDGLGWIDATVKRMAFDDETLRVPHVGWNELHQTQTCELFNEIPDQSLFYYVHSYHLESNDPALIAGTCPYGSDLTAVVRKDNIFGTQFHPEKSQQLGLQVLQNFIERV